MTPTRPNRVLAHLYRVALLQERGVTDADLLERFLARQDESAFEELVRRHGPMVLGVCRRVLGEPHAAADAFQATFLVLVRRAVSVVPRSRVGPWLYGVARRTALKARAAAARRRRAEQEAVRRRPRAAPAADLGGDLRPLLDEELGRLPEKYRAPLVLCLLEAKSRKEAAGLLACSEGTLSGRLARAKQLLGKRLRRRGLAPAGVPPATALAGHAAPAALPPALAAATVKAALSLGGPAAAPAVSAPVLALTEEVLKAMLASKVKAVVGVLVLAAGIGLGAGVVTWQYGPGVRGAAPAGTNAGGKEVAAPEKPAESRREQESYDRVGQGAAAVASEGKAEITPRAYVIEPPDILRVEYGRPEGTDPVKIAGHWLVRPDGTISLGQLGAVLVSGRTLAEARAAIAKHLASRLDGFDREKLTVEVVAYNSKVFYVIAEGDDSGDQVYRLPLTGNETVLDALAAVKGMLVGLGQKRVSLRRMDDGGRGSRVLPVDWEAITHGGNAATNYELRPGDRVQITSPTPRKVGDARGAGAVPAAGSDPVRELEAVLRALRQARSEEDQRRVVEDLDALTKKLRERVKEPKPADRP